MNISSVIPSLMERNLLFLMTVVFCSNIYLVKKYEQVVLNEKSRIYMKLLYFHGYLCYFYGH